MYNVLLDYAYDTIDFEVICALKLNPGRKFPYANQEKPHCGMLRWSELSQTKTVLVLVPGTSTGTCIRHILLQEAFSPQKKPQSCNILLGFL